MAVGKNMSERGATFCRVLLASICSTPVTPVVLRPVKPKAAQATCSETFLPADSHIAASLYQAHSA